MVFPKERKNKKEEKMIRLKPRLVCCGHSLKAVVDTHWKDLNLKNCKKYVGPDLNPNC